MVAKSQNMEGRSPKNLFLAFLEEENKYIWMGIIPF